MQRHRTTARGVILLLATCGVAALAASAGARPQARTPIVFPILGPVAYGDDFGDPRGQGRHEGNDILAPRKALALAAEAGTVSFWTTSANAGCMLYLHGDSGTTYYYIHLNNDLGTGNDNKGTCVAGTAYAPGLAEGDRVEAGEPVGFVGDSGDANGIHPHLHFEVHPKGGKAVDPFPYLRKARPLLFWEPDEQPYSLVLDGTVTAVGEETLTLRLTRLREWPSHQHQTKLGRTLTVALPEGTPVAPAPAAQVKARATASAAVGDVVRLWTGRAIADATARVGRGRRDRGLPRARRPLALLGDGLAQGLDDVDDRDREEREPDRRPHVPLARRRPVRDRRRDDVGDLLAPAARDGGVSQLGDRHGFSSPAGPDAKRAEAARGAQAATRARRKSTISLVGAPGVKISATPRAFSSTTSSLGIVPPTTTTTSSAPASRRSSRIRGTSVMCAPERIEMPTASASSWIAVSTICSGVWCRPV